MNKGNHRRHLDLNIDPDTLPTAQQKGVTPRQGKNGRWYCHHYIIDEVADAAKRLKAEIDRLSRDLPRMEDTKDTVWFASVCFVYALPTSYSKKRLGTYKVTIPDGDNMVKLLFDVITKSGWYWHNDAQVQIDGVVRRYITKDESPRILVTLRNRAEDFNKDPQQLTFFRKDEQP